MITLTKEEVDAIVKAIGTLPFNQVAPIIQFFAQKVQNANANADVNADGK